ncbi:magnesium-dependent phosphatase-1 [Sulfodiicoccus acidiphilus]|uniref:Magnesium-dependent phosphatase-1 n=1 Tax=Sulfodiicoccus acidiphilus TaxID=1670455 RepID=A0A348B747_9CREN|nr:magnesium-dependent phosphatase-1 [Sulfodiicoccus acidiphilus]BBD73999.1 magnesium-dependent phosphatase-1 [Sulfodiicoccus acidiphilus]GGT87266.1 magnesium-dependent phosphatase-1 [Sulfodiicoccus acidiphilus]
MVIKAVVYDADKTLWNHHNISELVEPMSVSGDVLVDGRGDRVVVFPGVRDTLKTLRETGIMLGLATWNYESATKRVLSLLDLRFDVVVSKDYPYKFMMLMEFLIRASQLGMRIKPDEVLYVDDRRDHFGYIWFHIGKVKCLEMWKDVKEHREILKMIENEPNS